jgi:hypothetical protein
VAYPAQITVEVADILEASPLSSSRAIVSRPAVGADPALVFAGVGSAVVVLQSDPANGNLSHFGAAATARIDVSGLVRNIALIDDTVYVAANRAGLVRLARSGNVWAEDFRYALPANGQHDSEQAFCVKAWSYTVGQDSGTRVLVGTCDELGQGALYLFDPEAGSPKLAVATGLGEVWTIAVAEGLVAGKVTVLVGTACRSDGPLHPRHRNRCPGRGRGAGLRRGESPRGGDSVALLQRHIGCQ